MLAEKLSGAVGNASTPVYVEDVFSTYLYTGNGTAQEVSNGINLDGRFVTSNIASVRNTESYSTIYAQGKYITCSGNRILTSTDGATWSISSSSPSGGYGNIAFNGTSEYMFVSGANGYCYTSTDLVNWTSIGTRGVIPTAFSAIGTTYVEFGVLSGTSTKAAYYSSNSGASWTSFSNIFTSYNENPGLLKLVNGILFACRSGGTNVKLASSTNGTTWTDRSSGISGAYAIFDITYGNGKYVAIDYAGNYYYSTDLSSWTLVSGAGGSVGNIGFFNGYFVSSGVDGTYSYKIKTSTDGATWTQIGGMPSVQSDSSNGMTCADGSAGVMFVTQAARNSLCVDPSQATKGGLVWVKERTPISNGHRLTDTTRGIYLNLRTDSTIAQNSESQGLVQFSNSGFALGNDGAFNTNSNSDTYTSWTFRKQPKFFDVVTYTGNGSTQNIAHSLGSTPGFIVVKRTDSTGNWRCYHRSVGATKYLSLNAGTNETTSSTMWNDTAPTSTVFTVGSSSDVNTSGGQYIAYLFAHDAGGFGLTGTDSIISCGTYEGNSSNPPTINLGWEPQLVIIKTQSYAYAGGSWGIYDTMRGMSNTSPWNFVTSNQSSVEQNGGAGPIPTATGFKLTGNDYAVNTSDGAPATYIYIAIRKGPMKVPTDATKVFSPATRTGTDAAATVTLGFSPDLLLANSRTGGYYPGWTYDRLRGGSYLLTPTNNAETSDTATNVMLSGQQNGYLLSTSNPNRSAASAGYVDYRFKRAPGFFDVVCWYGDPATVTHNLTVVPELIIQKNRTTSQGWSVWRAGINYGFLNTTAAFTSYTGGSATSTTFTPLQTGSGTSNYVSYLFATCPGVSKVGSYTGTGTTKQVDCGFSAGARFVLIKRTDSTGDWYVWDTARGIVSGTDPYLLLNSTAAEDTSTDYIDSYSSGFEISSTAPAAINASGGTYIFLAIA